MTDDVDDADMTDGVADGADGPSGALGDEPAPKGLSLRGLRVVYRAAGGASVTAVDGVDLDVAAGEVVAVPVLRPIFRWGLAAVGALGMALLILKTVFNVGSYAAGNDGTPARVAILLLAMLFGAAVGWFGAAGY